MHNNVQNSQYLAFHQTHSLSPLMQFRPTKPSHEKGLKTSLGDGPDMYQSIQTDLQITYTASASLHTSCWRTGALQEKQTHTIKNT
jgi:hypothetical protein